MDEREKEQFRAIAMGELSGNREWRELNNELAHLTIQAFHLLKSYGIESVDGMVFVCDGDIPVFTIEATSHMREHLR